MLQTIEVDHFSCPELAGNIGQLLLGETESVSEDIMLHL